MYTQKKMIFYFGNSDNSVMRMLTRLLYFHLLYTLSSHNSTALPPNGGRRGVLILNFGQQEGPSLQRGEGVIRGFTGKEHLKL